MSRAPRDVAVAQQTEQDEVAVPAVHLVEAAAGHDVRAGQVEQAGLGDGGGLARERGADRCGRDRRRGKARASAAATASWSSSRRQVDRPGRARGVRHLRIFGGPRQIGERARERVHASWMYARSRPTRAGASASASAARAVAGAGFAHLRARRSGRPHGPASMRVGRLPASSHGGDTGQPVRMAAACAPAWVSAVTDQSRSGFSASVSVASRRRSRRESRRCERGRRA